MWLYFYTFAPLCHCLAQTDGCDTAGGILTVKSMLKKNVQTAEMLKWRGKVRWCEFVNLWICEFVNSGFSRMRARARFLYSGKNIFYFIKYKYNTLHTHCQNRASPHGLKRLRWNWRYSILTIRLKKSKNSCFHLFTFSPFHLFTLHLRLITLKNKGIFLCYSQLDLYDKLWFITGHPLILLLLHRYPQERRHKSTSIVILSDFLSLSACVTSSLDNNKLMYLSLA